MERIKLEEPKFLEDIEFIENRGCMHSDWDIDFDQLKDTTFDEDKRITEIELVKNFGIRFYQEDIGWNGAPIYYWGSWDYGNDFTIFIDGEEITTFDPREYRYG